MTIPEYTVLIVEDRKDLLNLWRRELDMLSIQLNISRFEAQSARSFSEAFEKCEEGCEPDLAIIDHHLVDKDKSGYDVCLYLLDNFPDADIVVNTGYPIINVREISNLPTGNEDNDTLKVYQLYHGLMGLYPQRNIIFTQKYGVGKQIIDQLRPTIKQVIARNGIAEKLRERTLTRDPAMERCLKSLAFYADDPVLLLVGEKGTGKAHLAKALHEARRDLNMTSGPFINIDFPIDAYILERSAREGATALIQNISELSNEDWSVLPGILDIFLGRNKKIDPFTGENEKVVSGSAMLVLTDLEVPQRFNKEEKVQEKVYGILGKCSVNIPDLKDRQEDTLILARSFLTSLNAEYGTKYFLISAAEHHLKSTGFQGSVSDLKDAVERAVQIARREGSVQISPLHFVDIPHNFPPVYINAASKVPPARLECSQRKNNSPSIMQYLDAVKLAKSDLNQDKRVTTKMVDERLGKLSGGKATVNFLNRYYREIADFIEEDFLSGENEYQSIVPDLKLMCGKLLTELEKRGI